MDSFGELAVLFVPYGLGLFHLPRAGSQRAFLLLFHGVMVEVEKSKQSQSQNQPNNQPQKRNNKKPNTPTPQKKAKRKNHWEKKNQNNNKKKATGSEKLLRDLVLMPSSWRTQRSFRCFRIPAPGILCIS